MDYEVFVRFMARWTERERERFEEIQSLHYPPCRFVDMIQMHDTTHGAVQAALEILDEHPKYDYPARGSRKVGRDMWVLNECSGEL